MKNVLRKSIERVKNVAVDVVQHITQPGKEILEEELLRRQTLVKAMTNTIETLKMIAPVVEPLKDSSENSLDKYICEELKTGPSGCKNILDKNAPVSNIGLIGFKNKLEWANTRIDKAYEDKRSDLIEGQYKHLDNVIIPDFIGWLSEMKRNILTFQKNGHTKMGWIYNPRFTDQNVTEFVTAIDQGLQAMIPKSADYHVCEQIVRDDIEVESQQVSKKKTPKSLNNFWDTHCSPSSPDPEWIDSLFCKMGYGNSIATLVMKMRFTVPTNPNKHLLKNLYNVGLPKNVLDKYIKKIDCGRPFRWADIANLVHLVKNFAGLADGYLRDIGFTLKPVPSVERTITNRTKDLDALHKSKCTGDWKNTLFCEMGYDDPSALLIGKLKFAVPCVGEGQKRECTNPQNNAVLQIINLIIDAASGKGTTSSFIEKGVGSALSVALVGIKDKILTNRLLTWEDLSTLYDLTQVKGIQQILNMALASTVPDFINTQVNQMGLDFGV